MDSGFLDMLHNSRHIQLRTIKERVYINLNGIITESETRVNTFVDDPQLRIDGNSTVRVRLVMERIGTGLEQ